MHTLWRWNQVVSDWRAMQVIRRALIITYPFILVMTLIDAVGSSVLAANGFFFQIYHVGTWLPEVALWRQAFQIMGLAINNIVAVIVAFATGYFLALTYKCNALAVGLVSTIAFLTLNFNYTVLNQQSATEAGGQFVENNLGPQGIFLAIVVGLGVAWLAHQFVTRTRRWAWVSRLTLTGRVAWALSLVLVVTIAVGYGLSALNPGGLNGLVYAGATALIMNPGHYGIRILAVTTFNNLMWWLGLIGPVELSGNNSVKSLQNLAVAVQHGSVWHAPKPSPCTRWVTLTPTLAGPA